MCQTIMTEAAFQAEMTRRGYSRVGTLCGCGTVISKELRSENPALCKICYCEKIYREEPWRDKQTGEQKTP